MPELARRIQPRRRMTGRFASLGAVALLVIGCGGGAATGSTPGGGGASTPPGGGTGEPYDEALVTAAADVLAAVDSYEYDATIVQTGGSGVRTQTVHGIVRTSPSVARSVTYTIGADVIALMFVDGKDFADYGTGFTALAADAGTREETDPLAIRTLFSPFTGGRADDFVVAGKETVHDIATVHLVLDADALADERGSLGEGAEGWIAELWIAEADGQLVKAVWGGPDAPDPAAFGRPTFTIDITDTHCECPVTAPG